MQQSRGISQICHTYLEDMHRAPYILRLGLVLVTYPLATPQSNHSSRGYIMGPLICGISYTVMYSVDV